MKTEMSADGVEMLRNDLPRSTRPGSWREAEAPQAWSPSASVHGPRGRSSRDALAAHEPGARGGGWSQGWPCGVRPAASAPAGAGYRPRLTTPTFESPPSRNTLGDSPGRADGRTGVRAGELGGPRRRGHARHLLLSRDRLPRTPSRAGRKRWRNVLLEILMGNDSFLWKVQELICDLRTKK